MRSEEEKFYESLDRILSSSCSSTSASDDESDNRNRYRFPTPTSLSSPYDVWITEPGPVNDRRNRFLQLMGLAGDPLANSGELRRQTDPFSSSSDGNIDSPTDGCDDPRCTIRNLDTGSEFVVKEFREDGMWKKLREIGTGQQLTMEEFEICAGRSQIVQELMRRQNVGVQISGDEIEKRLKKNEPRRIFNGVERIRVRQSGKSFKEFSGLYLTQEIRAHGGSIWTVRFSLDGRYLASAGEDCVIHVWETTVEAKDWEKKMRSKICSGRKSFSFENTVVVPEQFFMLEEKVFCSFKGHFDDVLDLSWSKSQYLLSSSMDKTVRLWHISSSACLKIFSHSDYVTCIQFNPVDDRYFISGSLDKKIRIWSIPDCRVVDWIDLHEMVTAACYMPDGKGALVGSHKGSCHMYDTTDNKLHKKTEIDLQNKKKKSNHKKITGFQFAPGKNSELLITSADSRIRVVDGVQLVHKLKGFRNTSSQISASLTSNGNYAICASEDSHVYIWRYSPPSQPRRRCAGGTNSTQSYQHFHCPDVTAAIPWPNSCNSTSPGLTPRGSDQNIHAAVESPNANLFGDKASVTWPEEKLMVSSTRSSRRRSLEANNGAILLQSNSALGMVIVTAGRGGQIRTFQNFGFPVKS